MALPVIRDRLVATRQPTALKPMASHLAEVGFERISNPLFVEIGGFIRDSFAHRTVGRGLGSYKLPLLTPYRLVAFKRLRLVFQPQQGAKRTAAKGMGQHLRSVAHDKPWIVAKGRRHVANLHPALSLPADVLDFFRWQVRGSHHRGRTVVFLQPLIRDQPALAEILRHGYSGIGRGVLDVGPVHVAASEGEIGLNRLKSVLGITEDQPPTTYILFRCSQSMACSVALPALRPFSRAVFLAAARKN
jgi:hypothetical protein